MGACASSRKGKSSHHKNPKISLIKPGTERSIVTAQRQEETWVAAKATDPLGEFAVLPEDLVRYVIGFLSPKDIISVSTTSKKFHSITNHQEVWLPALQKECWFSSLPNIKWSIDNWRLAYCECPRVLYYAHKLTSDDTLSGLALRFKTTTEAIKRINYIIEERVLSQRFFVLLQLTPGGCSSLPLNETEMSITIYRDKLFKRNLFQLKVPSETFLISNLSTMGSIDEPDKGHTKEEIENYRAFLAHKYRSFFANDVNVALCYLNMYEGDMAAALQNYAADNQWENENYESFERNQSKKIIKT